MTPDDIKTARTSNVGCREVQVTLAEGRRNGADIREPMACTACPLHFAPLGRFGALTVFCYY